ncbi:hypothetical protein CBW65_18140 [Tumebacillus avium]|uniref:Uncharacterized protein n=1 Tax=Tumebacillus avium TaxID=1903704 RepID=A0A1Y0IQ81_9BACL|nr:hypothetical protein [Tumebacillus avium]ARU62681.1 hypothetical protein CBW65_18140 [Tumebacillus avium]
MKKGLVITVAAALMAAGIAGYSASADMTPKAEKLERMKKEVEAAEQELKTIQDPQVSAQKGYDLKSKNLELSKLEKELHPNPEKDLDEAIAGLETALEIQEKGYNIEPVDHKALATVKAKQKMLSGLKKQKEAKTKSNDQLMAELVQIRSIQEQESIVKVENP